MAAPYKDRIGLSEGAINQSDASKKQDKKKRTLQILSSLPVCAYQYVPGQPHLRALTAYQPGSGGPGQLLEVQRALGSG